MLPHAHTTRTQGVPVSTPTLTGPRTPNAAGTDAVLAALTRIEERLARLESMASTTLSEGRNAVGIVTDTVDRQITLAQSRGVDVDARAIQALHLAERVTEPRVLDALGKAIDLLQSAPHVVATLVDTADYALRTVQAKGIDVDARLANLLRASELLSSDKAVATLDATFSRIDQIRTVLESGILDPAAVAIVAKSGRALAAAASEPPDGVGAFGLVRAIGETEVRAATGLLLRFARRLGASLVQSKQLTSNASSSNANAAPKEES